jgi:hypothetical protein
VLILLWELSVAQIISVDSFSFTKPTSAHTLMMNIFIQQSLGEKALGGRLSIIKAVIQKSIKKGWLRLGFINIF